MFGDCHMHMVLDGIYYRDAIDHHKAHVDEELIRKRLSAYREAGITYLRDGGDAFGVAEKAAEIALEYGIEYRTPITPICLKGRYGGFIGKTFETLKEYHALVEDVKNRGGDFIKLMISGLMDFDNFGVITSQPLEFHLLREMVHIAHEEGFAVMAHANGAETIIKGLEAGIDSIEHGAYMNDEAVEALAQSNAVWVPTLVTIGNLIGDGRYPDSVLKPLLKLQQDNVTQCASLGGRIALGSDNGAYRVMHVQGTMDEYALLKAALGDRTDEVLYEGEKAIKCRFLRLK